MTTLKTSLTATDIEKLKAVLEWRRENEFFRFYKPNGPGERFLQALEAGVGAGGEDSNTIGIFSAANGVGKTTLVVNLLANLIWGPQSEAFRRKPFTNWSFPKRIRYVTETKLVEEIGAFNSEIQKWWPKGRFEALKNGHSYFSQYKAKDWVIDVMTYEQDLKQFEGGTMGAIIFDEPPPENIWNASIFRTRMGGLLLVFMTPLTSAAWFFDKVVPKNPQSIVYATMEDACKEHSKNGHLSHSRIDWMISQIEDPDEIEARAYGKALYLSGLIYKSFDARIHVLKDIVTAPTNATLYQAVDPHSDKPFASIWAYPDTNGDLYIVDEWPNVDFQKWRNCDLGIEDYKKIFIQKERGMAVHRRIIDRHFAEVRSAVNKKTLRDEFRNIGLDFWPSYKTLGEDPEVETGILKVKDYLKFDPTRPIDSLNRPRLYINPHCQNTIKAFQRWARDPKTQEPQDAYKDFMDCVRYLVMANPIVEEPVPYMPAVKRWG